MIECPAVRKEVIRRHYDLSTLFYRLFWGPHIHHGLWDEEFSPRKAQEHLIERLAALAAIEPESRVLDVGCGMGGSSIHLARRRKCRVTGVTLSPFQQRWATWSARLQGLGRLADFRCADAEQVQLDPLQFDVVWSIECTEHLFDKAAFFRRAAAWLKPGGRMAICAWLAGDTRGRDDLRQQVFDVCEGFFCPSLATADDYLGFMQSAGLEMMQQQDWTNRVLRTWEICQSRIDRTGVRRLARWIDRDQELFLDRFETILAAYRSGAMEYGCFVAQKPDPR